MIRGLYTAASGMTAQLAHQDVITNNLANIDTTGYKKDNTVDRAFSSLLLNRLNDKCDRGMDVTIGKVGTGVGVQGIYTDFSRGTMQPTENKLDLALAADGFFTIETPQGEMYTRDGSFAVNKDGELVTKDGFRVMGMRGAVNIGNAQDVRFNEDGSVIANGQVINQLKIVNASNPQFMSKTGKNLFTLKQGGAVADASDVHVFQGFLESSNVNTVSEMVKMITGLRLYETNQKSVQMQDGTLQKVINDVGRT